MDILLSVDGSDCSLRAVEGLIQYADELREAPQIHPLFVHPPLPMAFATQHISRTALDDFYREEGEAVLQPAVSRLAAANLPFVPHIHVGPVAETIVQVAGELKCRLICMGTRGRGSVPAALLGSVALNVLHLASLPVLLFK